MLLGDGDGRFGAPIDYDVGSDPESIAVGDFNGDSDPDLVTANYGSANVSVLLGEAGGSFRAATDYETGDGPYSVAVSDFDGDSDPDLAVANYFANDVSILRGGVGGSFGEATSLTADEGPTWVAPGDFDGDADPDLAVANWDSDNVSVLLNNRPPRPAAGPGTTSPAGTPPAAAGAEPPISRVWLGSRCVRRSRSGRVRVPINMSLARPAAVEIRIARAVKSKGRRSCPRSDRTRRPRHKTRFRTVTTVRRAPAQAVAAATARRITLNVRLTPGLYRLSVRVHLDGDRMSRPIYRYLRVVG